MNSWQTFLSIPKPVEEFAEETPVEEATVETVEEPVETTEPAEEEAPTEETPVEKFTETKE